MMKKCSTCILHVNKASFVPTNSFSIVSLESINDILCKSSLSSNRLIVS